jgi:hypothetical protein
VLLIATSTLAAQAPRDSSAFRRGQWGTEFATAPELVSLGVLRFQSTRRAWIADLSVMTDRRTETSTTAPDRRGKATRLQLQLGHRWYRPVSARIYQHAGVALGGQVDIEDFRSGASRDEEDFRGAGASGEVGAGWLVTRNFALGGVWRAQALWGRGRSTLVVPPSPTGPCFQAPCPQRVDTYTTTFLGLGEVSIRATLYY